MKITKNFFESVPPHRFYHQNIMCVFVTLPIHSASWQQRISTQYQNANETINVIIREGESRVSFLYCINYGVTNNMHDHFMAKKQFKKSIGSEASVRVITALGN